MTSKQYNKLVKSLESKYNAGKVTEVEFNESSQKLEMQRLMSLEDELDIGWVEDDPTEWMSSDF
tara:strand:- start:124 stop:315 length:192 start_codon:yes stop_codon:yes gene_type:complete